MDPYEKSKMFTKRYKKLKTLLKTVYGYDSFRSKQYEIINRIVCGEDVCATMSTGQGKSLTFQLPALYMDKPAIIISPLISLMDDQRMILDDLGISSCCYNSNANKMLLQKEIMQGKYKFIYITPESVINAKDFLIKLEDKQGISLISIDEAHCISAYGFDFRKSYRELSFFREILPNVPILAVTATATDVVSKDICKMLGFKKNAHTIIKTSFDRPNLYLEVRQKSKNIGSDIVPIIKEHKNESIIIYCLTKKETAKISEILNVHKIKNVIYHAGLDIFDREDAHKDFASGKVKVIICTVAFGMGINISEIRCVLHFGAPKNIEGYYQEIGRAGRDGKPAWCYCFFNYSDFRIQESFIRDCNDKNYQQVQLKMLERVKLYMTTRQCRRQMILEYFDEDYPEDNCKNCDNCCGNNKKMEVEIIKTEQNVEKEAKLLIDLIESITGRSFGITMYINLLRGSNNKNITSAMKKSKYYGKGKHRSQVWWKELADHLITRNFLQQTYLKGKFMISVIKPTKKGILWSNMSDLNGILKGADIEKLSPIQMKTTI